METQKIVNLLNSSENEYSKFATKKWYIIESESKSNYLPENPSKFLTSSLESSLCDCSDGYILVTGNITLTRTIAAADGNPIQRKQSLNAATHLKIVDHLKIVHLKIVHHLMIVEQKLMIHFLIQYCNAYVQFD